jgi:asparagine synthase (glutamine-hydrolysing)
LYRNIQKLRPGHILEIDLSGESLAWREYPYIGAIARSSGHRPRFDSAVEEYGRLLEQAVSRQLMSDVEVGVLLSGGIDSALVAANAQRAVERPLKAFTVGFKEQAGNGVDEIVDARETARRLGLEHYEARMGFDDFLETLRECVGIVEEPLATTSIVPMHYLARLAGSYVKVVMSGQGADEPLGGYKRYQVELYRRLVSPPIARFGTFLAGMLRVKSDVSWRALQALSETDDVSRFIKAHAVFTGPQIMELTGIRDSVSHDSVNYFYRLLGCEALPSTVERMMTLDARLGLADDLLLYTDKITMHHSLECRVPLLDLDLMAFLEQLPYDYRVRLGQTKIVHNAYAKQRLPASIIGRRKRGFLSPTRAWFRNAAVLRSLLLDRSSQFASAFDLAAVDTIIEEHQQGFNRERQIFLLLCLYYWFDSRPAG